MARCAVRMAQWPIVQDRRLQFQPFWTVFGQDWTPSPLLTLCFGEGREGVSFSFFFVCTGCGILGGQQGAAMRGRARVSVEGQQSWQGAGRLCGLERVRGCSVRSQEPGAGLFFSLARAGCAGGQEQGLVGAGVVVCLYSAGVLDKGAGPGVQPWNTGVRTGAWEVGKGSRTARGRDGMVFSGTYSGAPTLGVGLGDLLPLGGGSSVRASPLPLVLWML